MVSLQNTYGGIWCRRIWREIRLNDPNDLVSHLGKREKRNRTSTAYNTTHNTTNSRQRRHVREDTERQIERYPAAWFPIIPHRQFI